MYSPGKNEGRFGGIEGAFPMEWVGGWVQEGDKGGRASEETWEVSREGSEERRNFLMMGSSTWYACDVKEPLVLLK